MGISIFISYAREDGKHKDQLCKHLSILRDNGKIEDWSDDKILPGDKWNLEIIQKLKAAQIILLLVSPDFFASEFITKQELPIVLERSENDECRVVPIVLRACGWVTSAIGDFQALPAQNGNVLPIGQWKNEDEAFDVVRMGLEKIIKGSESGVNLKPPPAKAGISLAGRWVDIYNHNNGSQVTQNGNHFQFQGWGILPNGISFRSIGNGNINGTNVTSSYTATYQNGWTSHGNCFGTVNPNGTQMTLTFTDNFLGTFVSSSIRQ